MKTSCAIIQDLLPLYVDEICSGESRNIVEKHLLECASCREKHAAMRIRDDKTKEANDMKLADGLKKLKAVNGRRTKMAIAGCLAAVLVILAGFELLFVQPLKTLKPEDVQVMGHVYAVDDLPKVEAASLDGGVLISKGEDNEEDVYNIQIPSMPNAEISMTVNTLTDTDYITVVQWNSKYQLREIRFDTRPGEEDTLYVKDFKTSFFNNKADARIENSNFFEMRRISKIVYVNDDGSETVLWQAPAQIPTTENIEP